MREEDYNGWTNYQTWNVVLWLNNDQSMLRMFEYLMGKVENVDIFDFQAIVIACYETVFLKAETPDGVHLSNFEIDWPQIMSVLCEDYGVKVDEVNYWPTVSGVRFHNPQLVTQLGVFMIKIIL